MELTDEVRVRTNHYIGDSAWNGSQNRPGTWSPSRALASGRTIEDQTNGASFRGVSQRPHCRRRISILFVKHGPSS